MFKMQSPARAFSLNPAAGKQFLLMKKEIVDIIALSGANEKAGYL